MAKKGFSFKDVYNVQMSPKRKSYEKQKAITDLNDVGTSNPFYQSLIQAQNKQTFDKQACQERQVANQKQINELTPSKQALENQVIQSRTEITNQSNLVASNNTTLTGLESNGIVTTNGTVMELTPNASSLLPVTIGATTFTTTAQVQAHIDSTNTSVSDLIHKQNTLTGPYDNYTKLKTSTNPYNNLLAYQTNSYTGSNIANFANLVGFSSQSQNLAQLDQYSETNPAPVYGYQGQLNDINQKIASLQEDCNATTAQSQSQIEELELLTISSLIKDQEKSLGYKTKANPVAIALKYRALKAIDPKTNILSVVDSEFTNNSSLSKIDNKINNIGSKVESLTKAVEGKPGALAQIKTQVNQYGFFDPAVCGLLAIDNDGSILTTSKYHIPFQHIDVEKIKVSKQANYSDESPIGRYEPVAVYANSGPMTISIPLQYIAFESGYNSDEGFIQEIKDRFLSATFPVYGNYQRAGVRTYGAPHKYVLNMFEKFVNVPVYISTVSFEDQGGVDIYTWLAMGFKMTLELKTSYRVAQVISGDEVVDKGIRALAHKNNL